MKVEDTVSLGLAIILKINVLENKVLEVSAVGLLMVTLV
jgi:hypothetical protein